MLPRGGELERPPAALLPAHLGEVGEERFLELVRAGRRRRRDLLLTTEVGDSLREVPYRHGVDARQCRLGG